MVLEKYIKNYLLIEKNKKSNKVINYKHNKEKIKFGDLHSLLLLTSDTKIAADATKFVIKSAFRFLTSTVSAATLGAINAETLGELTIETFVDKLKEKNIRLKNC